MNNENFDLKEMKRAWTEMGKALGLQPMSGNTVSIGKKKTALDRLRDRYHTFFIISLIMVFGSFMIFSTSMLAAAHLRLWLGAAYAVYFLTASCMDFWMWRGLGTIDPLLMSVSEISVRSLLYRRRHLQFMAVLIPMAIALLGFTAYAYSFNTIFLRGMAVGVTVGAIIGIIQYRRFMAGYRRLSDEC